MFRKLVTNLPFNPSLIAEVMFYAERLKREQAIRRLGFFFVAITMFVQTFAFLAPPEKSLAASSSHIIDNLKTRDQILQQWDDPGSDVAKIYTYFGLTRDDIAALPQYPNRLNTMFGDNRLNPRDGNEYWTIGRTDLYTTNADQQYKDRQITIQIQGQETATTADDTTIYQRELLAWDIETQNSYEAWEGTAQSGEKFWILVDCGNFTRIGRTPPPKQEPIPAACSINGPIVAKPDESVLTIPVTISLPGGKSIAAGSGSTGLHIGIAAKGDPSTWNISDKNLLTSPPDKQDRYHALAAGTSGVTYYDFVWDQDGATYRRYYVTEAQAASFTVNLKIDAKNTDSALVVRLLDRALGEWLPHSAACETTITREETPKCEYNTALPVGHPDCKPKCPLDQNIFFDDPSCRPKCPYPGKEQYYQGDVECTPPPPDPEIEIIKTIVNKPASVKPGDTLTYLIQYRNNVNASLAENVSITDQLDVAHFDVTSVEPSTAQITNGLLKYDIANLPFTTEYKTIKVTVRLKDQLTSGTEICNASRMTASNAGAKDSSTVCVGVIVPCPYDGDVPDTNNPNCKQPVVVCELLDASINRTTRSVKFKATATSTNPKETQIYGYNYDFGDGSGLLTRENKTMTDEVEHTYAAGDYTAKLTIVYGATGADGKQETDCEAPIDFEADKPVGQAKTVRNVTKDKIGKAAVETKVQPNEILEYTLTTSNAQNYERVGIDVSDYIGDVLDYAVLDAKFLTEKGGTYDETTKRITWKNVTLPASGEVTHTFQVKIKDPIPATNSPSNVSTDYDCKITNEYGTQITISVDCPFVKGVQNLPNTGPGSSVLVMSIITTLVGYFFFRSRLLNKEINLVRNDYAMTGGM